MTGTIAAFLAAFCAASEPGTAVPAAASTAAAVSFDPNWKPSDEDVSRFDYLRDRMLRSQGPDAAAFRAEEKARAAACAKRLGPGSYEALVAFHRRCSPAVGCNKLAGADLYRLAEKLCGEPAPDAAARRALKPSLLHALDAFRPEPGKPTDFVPELLKAAAPFAKAVLPPEEYAGWDAPYRPAAPRPAAAK